MLSCSAHLWDFREPRARPWLLETNAGPEMSDPERWAGDIRGSRQGMTSGRRLNAEERQDGRFGKADARMSCPAQAATQAHPRALPCLAWPGLCNAALGASRKAFRGPESITSASQAWADSTSVRWTTIARRLHREAVDRLRQRHTREDRSRLQDPATSALPLTTLGNAEDGLQCHCGPDPGRQEAGLQ